MESRVEKAATLFEEGYNCSQSVFMAYADLIGMDESTAKQVSLGLGGGMGRMREVCGAVSGMVLLTGFVSGMENGADAEGKKNNYQLVQNLMKRFERENGSYICKQLLGLEEKDGPVPEQRTEGYYKKRPCKDLVCDAARILEKVVFTEENGY